MDTTKEDVDENKTKELKKGYESCKETATNEKLSPKKVEEDLNTTNNTEETIEEDMECNNDSQITSFSDKKIRAVDSVCLNDSSVKKEEGSIEEHIDKDQLDLNENSRAKVTKEEADKIKESISKAEDLIKKKRLQRKQMLLKNWKYPLQINSGHQAPKQVPKISQEVKAQLSQEEVVKKI